jgi:serine/threonine-protein kinase
MLVDTAPVVPRRVGASQLIGRTLGGFRIAELLATGGSADVYRADDVALERSATVKVLRTRSPVGYQIERFLREVKLAARLDHPYIAHVYGFGAEPDQLIWIAMEYVRGVTLESIVNARGRMPIAMFAPMFQRLCEVVHFAHERGIVHRDIKGGNVMIVERARQLLPKLLDFGVAKVADEIDFSDDATIGTPLFMAPEQWDNLAVDPRTDIYALGVLAHYCLSGRYPFEHHDRDTLRTAHLAEPPPRLGGVPPALAVAVERALAKLRVQRWQDALAFGTAVRSASRITRRPWPRGYSLVRRAYARSPTTARTRARRARSPSARGRPGSRAPR